MTDSHRVAMENLINAVISAYHTTRLSTVSPAEHILSKHNVQTAFADLFSAKDAEIVQLQETVGRVQASARALSSTQTEIYEHYRKASVLNTEAIETLDSEREANALLTQEIDELTERLQVIAQEVSLAEQSCPHCSGDCAGANPPVINCPMQMLKTIITG